MPSLPPSLFRDTQIANLISVWARTGNHTPLSFSSWTHAHRGGEEQHGGHQQLPLYYISHPQGFLGIHIFFSCLSQRRAPCCVCWPPLPSLTVCPYPCLCCPIQYKLCEGLTGTELPPCSQRGINQTRKMGACCFIMWLFVPLWACPNCKHPSTILCFQTDFFFHVTVGRSSNMISPAPLSPELDQRIRRDQQESC